METKEKEQVEQTSEKDKSEETLELTEEEQTQQVSNLLNGESKDGEATTEEETKSEETQESQEETQEETQVKEDVITDELITQFPTLKMYRGKPITDLAPTYDKLVRKLTKLTEEKKELERKLNKDGLDRLGDPPDPIDNPKEFKEWLVKRDKIVAEQAQRKEPESQVNYMSELQRMLPEVNVQQLTDEWAKYNSEILFDETGQLRAEMKELYQKNPELLVSNIINFYNLSTKAQQNELTIEKKAKEKAYEETKNSFKQARNTKTESSQVNVVKKSSESTPEEQILTGVYNIVKGEDF